MVVEIIIAQVVSWVNNDKTYVKTLSRKSPSKFEGSERRRDSRVIISDTLRKGERQGLS